MLRIIIGIHYKNNIKNLNVILKQSTECALSLIDFKLWHGQKWHYKQLSFTFLDIYPNENITWQIFF